ncbi:MAG TPA: tetratricopeptide repeat protein [Terriglobales bacterium]|jgi:diguanylate cyclase (GGDEF)-like protein|nr:tetratricopeptide repeat protein [Terriglobales bacterium]
MTETPKRADRQEIARRVERGEKLLQKGKPAEALEEFLQTLALDPASDTVRQMAADLCLSLQRLPEAVRLLGELFERQLSSGDGIRASLTYKKLARFANPSLEQKKRFAELLEKSNRKLAVETYESVLEEFRKQGRKTEALAILKKIVALESSERNIVRLGELSSEVGDGKQAASAFLQLAQMAEGAGGDPSQWYERAYSEDAMDETIAIGYARSLMLQQQVGAAIFVLDPLAAAGNTSAEFRDLYARALLSANRLTEAAPLVWQIFEQNPSRIEQVRDLIGAFLDSQLDREAVVMAEKLEHFQRRKGERRAFLAMMQDIVAGHRASVEMLEFLAEQFNSANREADYCATLLRLFDIYCSENRFDKAGEALDRAVEIDPYENGHQKRLQALKGKVEENRYQVISSRLGGTAPAAPAKVTEEKSIGSSTLQDLMVQAEILVQYGMRNKALERLQRIQQLFPHEEERNPELQQLYLSAGLMPQYGSAQPLSPAPAPARAVPESPAATVSFDNDMSGFARVSEITKKLNRENSAAGVLNTMSVEIGTQWSLDRCVAALRKPGLSVTLQKEFAAGAAAKPDLLDKLICGIHDIVVSRGAVACTDIASSPELRNFAQPSTSLGVRSCVALPLGEGGELGLLLLLSNNPRSWSPNDVLVFKMIADQGGIALNNAGLRRLVKNLSVTDENSGLLKRASYLDLLLGEVRRAKQQSAALSVMIMRFGERAALAKEQGEAAAESTMQRLGQVVAANVRQNDLAFRYASNAIAIVLGETAEKEALLVAEKMRRVMGSAVPEKQLATQFNAGIAEAVIRQEFDTVDIVTELINRAERSLEKSVAEGPGKSATLPAAKSAAAVA